MTSIEVTANVFKPAFDVQGTLVVSIKNNGQSIPINIHATENIYIPELIFGHLLTGSNFDDSISSITGIY